MKYQNILSALAVGLLTLLTACDTGNVGTIYQPSDNEKGYSFMSEALTSSYKPGYTETTYKVRIGRNFTEGRNTLPLTYKGDTDLFTLPQSVTFEDGQGHAYIYIGIAGMATGESYSFTIAIDSANLSRYNIDDADHLTCGIAKTEVTLVVDYTWVSAGLVDFEFEDGFSGSAEIPVEKALEFKSDKGWQLYRLNSWWYYIDGEYAEEDGISEGTHLQFLLDADYNAVSLMNSVNSTGFNYGGSYGTFYYYYDFNGNYGCAFKNESNHYVLDYVLAYDGGTSSLSLGFYGHAEWIWKTGYPGPMPEPEPSIEDYTYEAIEGAVSYFESGFGLAYDATLAKCKEVDSLYVVKDAYGKGNNLYFYMFDDNTIRVIDDQPTGTEVAGHALLFGQNPDYDSYRSVSPKGVEVYTFVVDMYYDNGALLATFSESFTYSLNPIEYTIDDFCGYFTCTGYTPFSNGNDLNTLVRIVNKGDTALAIKGLPYAEETIAEFDAEQFTMNVYPQGLADYVTPQGVAYDMSLLTFDEDFDYSIEDPMVFGMKMTGQLALTGESVGIGYLIYSQKVGGLVDGYYDMTFTPAAAPAMAPLKSAPAFSVKNLLSKPVDRKAKLDLNHLEFIKVTDKMRQPNF